MNGPGVAYEKREGFPWGSNQFSKEMEMIVENG